MSEWQSGQDDNGRRDAAQAPGSTGEGTDGRGDRADAARGSATHARDREFRLTNFAVAHPTSVLVLLFIIALLGITAYRTVPKEAFPEITIPIIAISTVYPGATPTDVESLITRVIEEEVHTIPEVRTLTSTSTEGYSIVIAEFGTGMDMEVALRKVTEKVDLAKPELPADLDDDPVVSEINLSEFPIMQVNISGEYGLVRLKDVAEELQDRLEQIPSLLDVRISGGLERRVHVDVDLPRLQYYGVTYSDVIDAIWGENVNIPGGVMDVGTLRYPVRVAGEFQDPQLLEDVVIVTRNGGPIYVRDVATVDFGFEERESYARLNSNPVVTLDIIKRAGENVIDASDQVKAVIEEMRSEFPPTTVVTITGDQAEDIGVMVSSLENNIISGLILVLAVLLFFLGARTASFVAISIPLSMLLSFVIMQLIGMTMNTVVLFALILALGMLVDNAVVVVENIYRHLEEGYDNVRAAIRAVGEVAIPIIASTMTTLAAFFPLLFWPDIVGEFMGFLPKTLIITLSSSLFVALVIVPVLCALFMRLDGMTSKSSLTRTGRWSVGIAVGLLVLMIAVSNVLAALLLSATAVGLLALHRFVLTRVGRTFQLRLLPAVINGYELRLRWALRHRLLVMGAAFGLLIGSVVLFGVFNRGVEFFPESVPPQIVYVQIDAPSGSRPDFVNSIATRLERQLAEIEGIDDAESIVSTVGAVGDIFFGGGGDGSVTVNFVDYSRRRGDVFVTLRRMQETLGAGIAGADVKVEAPAMGPPTGKPVNIEIVGEDPELLKQLGDRVVNVLRQAPVFQRLEGLENELADARPELVIEVDRERAALFGLSTRDVGSTVRSAIQGSIAARYRTGNDEHDIVVRLAEPYRNDLDGLRDLSIMGDGDRPIPLLSVARWSMEDGFGSIQRKDLDRVATVSSDVRAGENSNAVLGEVRATLAEFEQELPLGYSMSYTGQQEEQQDAEEFLSTAFLITILLIGFILISVFNSVVKPIIILTSVMMSTVGVLLGLMIFQMPFGIIMTGVGIISLAGVVVNNAIVLIDYIDLLRTRDGLSRIEAVVRGGMTRFRPVILTAMTTVLGLIPLAIGLNIDFFGLFTALAPNLYWGGEQAAWWGSMAIAVIAGLSFATLLTLFLVPVMYSLVEDMADWFRRHFIRSAEPEPGAGQDEARTEVRQPAAAGAGAG